MKIIYHGVEVELDDELEPGEKELDMRQEESFLEDTIELTEELERIKEKLLEKTGEFNYEQY